MKSELRFSSKNFGGNIINSFDSNAYGRYLFANDKYTYYLYYAKEKDELVINELKSFTVFFYKGDAQTTINIANRHEPIKCGDMIQVENSPLKIKVEGGSAQLLIAGIKQETVSNSSTRITKCADIKKVSKPWGFELWINGEHPGYAFKKIYIQSGFRTSLQYHNLKRETNVLFEGNARLHYKCTENVENDKVNNLDVAIVDISAPMIIDVTPKVLHRIESISDIILCEVSTPHLDDVVRVLDDKERPNGRIEEEHK